jgi:replicative DNA helicase
VLVAGDFYDTRHEKIFQAIASCQANGDGRRADFIVVADQMRHEKTIACLTASGGDAYLAQLANEAPAVEHAAAHARVVKDKSTLRKMVLVASEIRDMASADDRPTIEVVNAAQTKLAAVMDSSIGGEPEKLKPIMFECAKELDHAWHNRGAIVGVPSGFDDLDELTAGLSEGLIIIAARPSMGKTSFAMQQAIHAGSIRIPVLVFSLESAKKSLGKRILASEGRVDSMAIRTGMMQHTDLQRMALAMPRISGYPIWIDDQSSQTVETIVAKTMRWRRRDCPDAPKCMVIIDYLQYIKDTNLGGKRGDNRHLAVSHISRALKTLSKEIHAPVVALAQLNRGVESRSDKRPMQSDLKESGDIEQDADVIMGIYRDDYYNKDSNDKGIAEILLLKNRDGATGVVKLAWLPQYTRFENLSKRRD